MKPVFFLKTWTWTHLWQFGIKKLSRVKPLNHCFRGWKGEEVRIGKEEEGRYAGWQCRPSGKGFPYLRFFFATLNTGELQLMSEYSTRFKNSLHIYDIRASVRLYVCCKIRQMHCGRTVCRTAFILGSFERHIPVLWLGVKRFVVSRDLDLFI